MRTTRIYFGAANNNNNEMNGRAFNVFCSLLVSLNGFAATII